MTGEGYAWIVTEQVRGGVDDDDVDGGGDEDDVDDGGDGVDDDDADGGGDDDDVGGAELQKRADLADQSVLTFTDRC